LEALLDYSDFNLRRHCVIAGLLILTLTASSSACVEGAGNPLSKSCANTRQSACSRKTHVVRTSKCSLALRSLPGHCGIRGLLQLHLLALRTAEASMPLQVVSKHISLPFGPAIRISSVGSPETDRGPPLS